VTRADPERTGSDNPKSAIRNPKLGVLLFNLGGPERLEDVRPFLFNLFSDPDIIRIKNDNLRKALAWFIAATRQRKSRSLYRQIGGGSPLRRITEQQAEALCSRLAEAGVPALAYVGMRCWKPTIDEAVERILDDGVSILVVLPLFPQYSFTTTGSCFNYFKKLATASGLESRAEITYVQDWHDNPLYVDAVADQIRASMTQFSDQDPGNIHVLYSAHSIPAKYVREGDPYLEQTQKTVALINASLRNVSPSILGFQSKVGPVKWLEPSTMDLIAQFGRNGTRQVLAVPISFVSDHIETLQEIDILYKQMAQQAGIAEFRRAASLNLYPKFIDALAKLVLDAVQNFTSKTQRHQERLE
jgi:ferrochelatase